MIWSWRTIFGSSALALLASSSAFASGEPSKDSAPPETSVPICQTAVRELALGHYTFQVAPDDLQTAKEATKQEYQDWLQQQLAKAQELEKAARAGQIVEDGARKEFIRLQELIEVLPMDGFFSFMSTYKPESDSEGMVVRHLVRSALRKMGYSDPQIDEMFAQHSSSAAIQLPPQVNELTNHIARLRTLRLSRAPEKPPLPDGVIPHALSHSVLDPLRSKLLDLNWSALALLLTTPIKIQMSDGGIAEKEVQDCPALHRAVVDTFRRRANWLSQSDAQIKAFLLAEARANEFDRKAYQREIDAFLSEVLAAVQAWRTPTSP